MKIQVDNERRLNLTECMAMALYRFLESIDGEKGARFVPYGIIQPVKMHVLTLLK